MSNVSDATRRKLSEAGKGRVLTEEERAKISAKAKARWADPERRALAAERARKQWEDKDVSTKMRVGISKAISNPTETRRAQISKQRKGKTLAQIHGPEKAREIYFARYGFYPEERKQQINRRRDFEFETKKWARAVYERDSFMCQICGASGKGIKLHAHHVKRWIDAPELRFDISNGQTLCDKCHRKHHAKDVSKQTQGMKRDAQGRLIKRDIRADAQSEGSDKRAVPLGGDLSRGASC